MGEVPWDSLYVVSDPSPDLAAATHHEGIGEAQAHQAGRQPPVQGVGDGGHGRDEDHTCTNVLLWRDRAGLGPRGLKPQ